jgi:hypothetical protein
MLGIHWDELTSTMSLATGAPLTSKEAKVCPGLARSPWQATVKALSPTS